MEIKDGKYIYPLDPYGKYNRGEKVWGKLFTNIYNQLMVIEAKNKITPIKNM